MRWRILAIAAVPAVAVIGALLIVCENPTETPTRYGMPGWEPEETSPASTVGGPIYLGKGVSFWRRKIDPRTPDRDEQAVGIFTREVKSPSPSFSRS